MKTYRIISNNITFTVQRKYWFFFWQDCRDCGTYEGAQETITDFMRYDLKETKWKQIWP